MSFVTVWLIIALQLSPLEDHPGGFSGYAGGVAVESAAVCRTGTASANKARTEEEIESGLVFVCVPSLQPRDV